MYCYATFSAIDRAPHEAFPQDRLTLSTKSYTLEDNGGYNIYGRSDGYNPLGGKAFSSVSLDFVGGSLIEGNEVNGIRQYGYLMSDVYGTDDNVGLKLLLKYNYKTSADDNRIYGTNYYISEDSYSGAINGVSGVGVVQSGALLVQKLKKGGNPNNAADWTWENPISKGTTESFHTTDFTDNYRPNDYDGRQHTIRTIGGVPIYNADGTVDYLMSGDNYVYQDCYKLTDGYIPVYTPSGEELKDGITLRILFVYEIKRENGDGWTYLNVAEETTVSIYPSNANILFQNLNFTSYETVEEAELSETAQSELIRQFGYVKSNHNVNDAFRVNFNGNTTYKVEYYRNGATNREETKYAYDGQVFSEPGKYVFRVIPVVGETVETVIYINDRGIVQNYKKYFGDGLITEESHRVFTMTEIIPEYLSGKTYWATQTYDDNTAPLVGRIGLYIAEQKEYTDGSGRKYIVYEGAKLYENDGYYKQEADGETSYFKIVEKIEGNRHGGESGVLNESGLYNCEFANNRDFFNNQGEMSGDVYYYTFRFIVTEKAAEPSLNEEFLNSNNSYADYDSLYYGVAVNTKGSGRAIYAYREYAAAKQFAYEYEKGQVRKSGSGYIYNGKTYTSEKELYKDLDAVASGRVEKRYFDGSDRLTYVTIKGKAEEISELEIERDVIVFETATTSYLSTAGIPYLNDRAYAYIDENGNSITSGKNELRFIQIAKYESGRITMTLIDGETNERDENYSWEIPYDYPIQKFLEERNAPSGKYEIREENADAENVYYGRYIAAGDNRTTLTITRIAGSNQVTQDLTKGNGNIRFSNINGLILHSASNALDPYGIVKITDAESNEVIKIMSLSEVNEYNVIEESGRRYGHFRIDVVDRLGNIISYYADIYDATSFHELTFKDGEETVIEGRQYGNGAII